MAIIISGTKFFGTTCTCTCMKQAMIKINKQRNQKWGLVECNRRRIIHIWQNQEKEEDEFRTWTIWENSPELSSPPLGFLFCWEYKSSQAWCHQLSNIIAIISDSHFNLHCHHTSSSNTWQSFMLGRAELGGSRHISWTSRPWWTLPCHNVNKRLLLFSSLLSQ